MADDDNDQSGKTAYKLMALLASLLGAMAARKTMTFAWKAVSGKEPPANPEHPEVSWGEAVSWALASGAAVGLARLVAQKRVATTWHRSTGSLPPGLERTAA
ncbi:MAG TPA: DUF4235 domain-containing protein [Mycobacteriales bacterium]|nr:DUF4235 domain-containing protein [Mycobacteriales bacterium]